MVFTAFAKLALWMADEKAAFETSAWNADCFDSALNAAALREKTAIACGCEASAWKAFGFAEIAAKACGLEDTACIA